MSDDEGMQEDWEAGEVQKRIASSLLDGDGEGEVWAWVTGIGNPESDNPVHKIFYAPEGTYISRDPRTGHILVAGTSPSEVAGRVSGIVNTKARSPEEALSSAAARTSGDLHMTGLPEDDASFFTDSDYVTHHPAMWKVLGHLNEKGQGNTPRSYAEARAVELLKKRKGGLGSELYKGNKGIRTIAEMRRELAQGNPELLRRMDFMDLMGAIPLFSDTSKEKGWGFTNDALVEKMWRDRGVSHEEDRTPFEFNVKTAEDIKYDLLMDKLWQQLLGGAEYLKKHPQEGMMSFVGISHAPSSLVRSVHDTMEGKGSNDILSGNDFRTSAFYLDPSSMIGAQRMARLINSYFELRPHMGGKEAFMEALKKDPKGLKSDVRVKDVVLSDEEMKDVTSGIYRGLEPLMKQRRITEALLRRF